jgi:hypothetical protein
VAIQPTSGTDRYATQRLIASPVNVPC